MEEELNENDLEERLYAMLHHVDETQANVTATGEDEVAKVPETAPRSTIRRYWRSGVLNGDLNTFNPYQKVNTPKVTAPLSKTPTNDPRPKEEKCDSHDKSLVDLSIFQSTPNIIKSTIEILDHDIHNSVLLETSDEDEVVEVALPPKPTITIESSDEDEIHIVTRPDSPSKEQVKHVQVLSSNGDRESASPVPSVVSSVSDDFIRGDCIALNISSRRPDDHSFDFSLHGSDLLGQKVSKKRKKKKSKDTVVTSTPVSASDVSRNTEADECFATPKSKAKHKKQKTKSYVVTEKSVPSADVYDSDSNQSVNNVKSHGNTFVVSNTSLPNADVYESDSNQSEVVKENVHPPNVSKDVDSSDSSVSLEEQAQPQVETPKTSKSFNTNHTDQSAEVLDLTDNDYVTLDTSDINISENIVMANVTGFKESSAYEDEPTPVKKTPNYGSTRIPPILYDNLDFDNLKGIDKECKRRRYSLTTLRADMQKFYNESWGGEDFNHREIQKHMSKDESLWMIDPKDRMPMLPKRRISCNYCNRIGHRDDTCRMKPPVCYMCGSTGHFEPRCPTKMCINCGAPNHMYSSMCRNCSFWNRIKCAECGQAGHPASHCPDTWRRYHSTIDVNAPLEEIRQTKKNHQLFCSGCARRGHLVHTCRFSIPFSATPMNSPYVYEYRPLYLPSESDNNTTNDKHNRYPQNSITSSPTINNRNDYNKRMSKSPSSSETLIKKKKHSSFSEGTEQNRQFINKRGQRKISLGNVDDSNKATSESTHEKAPDFIPINSTNHDKKGQMIQDNEVSDTSDVITMARIYITRDTSEKLKSKEGQEWMNETMKKCNVTIQNSDMHMFMNIKGRIADQEAFQAELRDWTISKENCNNKELDTTLEGENDNSLLSNIPKNRNNVLRVINKALESLNDDLGDPSAIYKELVFLQSRHQELLQQKVISPLQVSNNRDNINVMLKKLNMVLLGQAGLADGTRHLNELMSIQKMLTNLRQKTITPELRKQIGQHYHCIFTAAERNDYSELLQKYFDSKKLKSIAKKRNRNKFNAKRKLMMNTAKNGTNFFYNQSDSSDKTVKDLQVSVTAANNDNNQRVLKNSKITVWDLIVYHTRLLKFRPNNSVQKKKKMDLARKLHSHIVSLHSNDKLSTKAMKKVKKTQTQAIMFLNNL